MFSKSMKVGDERSTFVAPTYFFFQNKSNSMMQVYRTLTDEICTRNEMILWLIILKVIKNIHIPLIVFSTKRCLKIHIKNKNPRLINM